MTLPALRLRRRRPAPDALAEVLLDQTQRGVLITDRDGRLVRFTEKSRTLAAPDATLDPGAPVLDLFDPADRDGIWQAMRAALVGRGPQLLSVRIGHAPPTQLRVALTIAPLAPPSAQAPSAPATGLVLLLADLTAQLRLEAQLAQSQKLQAVGELAAGIAHDFNNLLTAVLGAADAICARPAIDADTREDATQIRGSAERGGALVRQLLAFGRQQALQPRIIAINDAITDLTSLLARLLGSGIRLLTELDPAGHVAAVDPTQLDQVLINLAVNARDAMPDGGTLTLRSGHITLHRPLALAPEPIPPGRYVMIEVQDTGTGIDPDLLPRIFDPFVTTKRNRGGTGLGLSTVHGIVRQSGGFLGVESEPGTGTRMRVYLPRQEDGSTTIPAPPQPTQTPTPTPPPQVQSDPIVLLVEDEPAIRRLAERALAQAGWTVLTADCAETAQTLLQARPEKAPLDLLVTDVVMPGQDGPALAATLRETWPHLPVLLVSGYTEDRLPPPSEGPETLFLPKPYRLEELIATAAGLR